MSGNQEDESVCSDGSSAPPPPPNHDGNENQPPVSGSGSGWSVGRKVGRGPDASSGGKAVGTAAALRFSGSGPAHSSFPADGVHVSGDASVVGSTTLSNCCTPMHHKA